jgi:hypothetical protein
LRLSFRLQRLEIILLGAATLAGCAMMLWWAYQLAGVSEAYPNCRFFNGEASGCEFAQQRFFEISGPAEIVIRSMAIAAAGIGLVLGVSLVAREIESKTAQFAWTIGRSRVRWFVGRFAFAALVVVLLTAVLAVATDILAAQMRPDLATASSFELYGNRGPLVVGKAILGLGAGLLVGAIVGRQVAALLIAAVVVAGLYGASAVIFPMWNHGEGEARRADEAIVRDLWIESGIELPDGTRIAWPEANLADAAQWSDAFITPDGTYYASASDAQEQRNPLGREYVLVIPGERYSEIAGRESAAVTCVGLLLVAGALAVVRRRRPA